jgi:sugar phosphate permease
VNQSDTAPNINAPSTGQAYFYLATLIASYIGVYLCRKNLSVAVPILQQEWGLSKEQVGIVASVSTIAYAAGKFLFGPVTDRLGGRTALLGSMSLVALFGFLGGLAPSLGALTVLYSLNRLAGSASWGAMVKMLPDWFSPSKLPFACGLLSLSFVFGGALATSVAGLVAHLSRDSSFAVLSLPSLVVVLLVIGCWLILPRGGSKLPAAKDSSASEFSLAKVAGLFKELRFLIILALSFTLTMIRETFNFWTVDFIRTESGGNVSNALAAYVSTPFDICGALGIILMGWYFGRVGHKGRRNVLVAVLLALSVCLAVLPVFFNRGFWVLAGGVGLVGFLVYGPYSLLAGVFAVEVRGKAFAATVAGLVDGAGYVAGVVRGPYLTCADDRRLPLGFKLWPGLLLFRQCSAAFYIPGPLNLSPGSNRVTLIMMIKLVVFDMAGTTIRDDDAVHHCLAEALRDDGVHASRKEINRLMGLPKPIAIRMLLEQLQPAELSDERVERIDNDFLLHMIRHYETHPDISPMPHAEDTLLLLTPAVGGG